MKVAVVYNRESRKVINLFGTPNRETIGLKTIKRISDALKKGGHQVTTIEGDKDLIARLEDFMPRVIKHERPGMVFNVSYGIQGQARYTHVPSILEMVGVPYVASGPLAHSLSLDKVVAKMILRQHDLPTPDFAVLNVPDDPIPALTYPLIVKPKSEAVSFGLCIVENEDELRVAVKRIYDEFRQPVLVEQYIDGREINVGLLGNNPPEVLPPVELKFGSGGPPIYTYEDKTRESGRQIECVCPAPVDPEIIDRARDLALKAFNALGCYDCVRVDMRLDEAGQLYILELNSLPSLGEHGSYLVGAAQVGLDFTAVINRLVEVASARYFGTPDPPSLEVRKGNDFDHVVSFITQRRDEMERRVQEWTELSSQSNDPIGLQAAVSKLSKSMADLGMKPIADLTDERSMWSWATAEGFERGILLIGHLDVPVETNMSPAIFHRDPEMLYGDGIGSSRAPLVMLEFALRSLRGARRLKGLPIGVSYYLDEGRDACYSAKLIREASERARRVLVLRPGNVGGYIVTSRRGQRKYRFLVEGEALKPGKPSKRPEVLRWACAKLEEFAALSQQKQRVSVSMVDLSVDRLPMLLPHRCAATVLVTFPDAAAADRTEEQMRALLDKSGPKWKLELLSDRAPMIERKANLEMAKQWAAMAEEWDIPLKRESSVWPSVAGLVSSKTACLCGIGPVAHNIGTPQESVERISLVQRSLLLAHYLATLNH